MKRIGITLRTCQALGYQEARDGLARDWYRFLQQMDWGWDWVLLPNLGAQSVAYAQAQHIEGLILSGGEDLGSDPLRDESELALLKHAIMQRLPVLGVCRGMQLIQRSSGGKLVVEGGEHHVSTRHTVSLCRGLPWRGVNEELHLEANSYHANRIPLPLPTGLWALAIDADGYCEAFLHQSMKLAGIMWHPEREVLSNEFDRQLCRWLFQ
ncbi:MULTISPECIES: gamma-glutamyl-gamma-aminobutyrate hydrolase family protein [Aeromonas]|uniref:gamma-glutamyl-gamma-aminobutyrate hydrolase family protein n=1 Tax=Aeromonas TaxID=642 RepID=UPI000FBB64F0|nr:MULTISPECIES: gamma-glutamyl-gamma-aminobutyrate hydrolase family protein [Aeromonas]MCE9925848.1 gamma-glutamyl-gamma-aminobutyrate hydrolase family protein [Aeromonas media]MDM5058301.1 gamma-glutamyl-gamma-aminobutyrate hydrolase family protein [Aeromonas rivipollensis]MDW4561125.1 gamma-glutamyl-gamma-aminobutyrate hydrolase family protein [Aeromonas rivipollensis]